MPYFLCNKLLKSSKLTNYPKKMPCFQKYVFSIFYYMYQGGFSDLENLNIYYMGFYRVKALFSQTYKWDLIC